MFRYFRTTVLAGTTPKRQLQVASPASDSVNDFHPVTRGQSVFPEAAAGHQFPIDLHGEALAGQLQPMDEVGHIDAVRGLGRVPVENNLHIELRLRYVPVEGGILPHDLGWGVVNGDEPSLYSVSAGGCSSMVESQLPKKRVEVATRLSHQKITDLDLVQT